MKEVERGEWREGKGREREGVSEISGFPLVVLGYLYGWMGVWMYGWEWMGMDGNGYGLWSMNGSF